MLWVCVASLIVGHQYYHVCYMLWTTCCGIHIVDNIREHMWITLIYIVDNTIYDVGKMVVHNIYQCYPQHTTHSMPPTVHKYITRLGRCKRIFFAGTNTKLWYPRGGSGTKNLNWLFKVGGWLVAVLFLLLVLLLVLFLVLILVLLLFLHFVFGFAFVFAFWFWFWFCFCFCFAFVLLCFPFLLLCFCFYFALFCVWFVFVFTLLLLCFYFVFSFSLSLFFLLFFFCFY